jgi:hypothetical protein
MTNPSGSNRPLRGQPDITGDVQKRLDATLADPTAEINLLYIYEGPEALPQDMAERVRSIYTYHKEYMWPFIKATLRYMIHSGMPKDQIAQRYNVSFATITNWIKRLTTEREAGALNLVARNKLFEMMERKDLLREQAMQQAAIVNNPREKAVFLRLASTIDNDLATLMHMGGAFADEPLSAASLQVARNTGHAEEESGAPLIGSLLKEFLADTKGGPPPIDAEVVSETPPIKVRPRRPAGN